MIVNPFRFNTEVKRVKDSSMDSFVGAIMVIFPFILSSKRKLLPVISLINLTIVEISTSTKLKAIWGLEWSAACP